MLYLVGLLIGIFVLFLLVLPFVIPLSQIDILAGIFNKLAIGAGALFAVMRGSDYLKKMEEASLIKFYRNKYPVSEDGKAWKIIVHEKRPGTWYLLDMKQLQKHHIGNMKTVYDLGFQSAKHEILKESDFLSYFEGDRIMTRGNVGE